MRGLNFVNRRRKNFGSRHIVYVTFLKCHRNVTGKNKKMKTSQKYYIYNAQKGLIYTEKQ